MRLCILTALLGAAVARGAAPPVEKGVPRGAKLYALLVGVDDYSKAQTSLPNVVAAAASVRILAKALKGRARPTYSAIEATTLLDHEATASRILGRLKALAGVVRPEDRVVVLLAGHGVGGRRKAAFVSRSGRSYTTTVRYDYDYICYDYDPRMVGTSLSAPALFSALKPIKGHVLVLVDTCHSGALCEEAPAGLLGGKGKYVLVAATRQNEECVEPLKLTPAFPCSFVLMPLIAELRITDRPLDTWRLSGLIQNELPAVLKKFDSKLAPGKAYEQYLFNPLVWPTAHERHWSLFRTSSTPR